MMHLFENDQRTEEVFPAENPYVAEMDYFAECIAGGIQPEIRRGRKSVEHPGARRDQESGIVDLERRRGRGSWPRLRAEFPLNGQPSRALRSGDEVEYDQSDPSEQRDQSRYHPFVYHVRHCAAICR